MALSANTFYRMTRGLPSLEVEILNTQVMFHGAYAAAGHVDHATAGNRGRMFEFNDNTAGVIPLGFVSQKKTGDTAASPTVKGVVHTGGGLVKDITVTDVNNNITDQFRWVFATDDGTFTLAAPATSPMPIGITTRYIAANTFDVYFLSFEAMLAIAAGGGIRRVVNMATFVAEAGTGAATDLVKGMVCPFHAHIIDYFAICLSAPADVDVAGPVTLEVGGVDLNFATTNVTIAAADTLGLRINGVGGITATAVHPGTALDLEADFTAAGTVGDGIYGLYVDFLMQPGV